MSTSTKTKTIGFCAICEGDFAVKKGALVHHGYKRPGHGYIVGDCLCVHQAPYELSCEPLRPYLARIQTMLADTEGYLRRLTTGEVTELRKDLHVPRGQPAKFEKYTSTETEVLRKYEWERLLKNRIWETERQVEGLMKDVKRIENHIARWELKPLREETKVETDRSYGMYGYVVMCKAGQKVWTICKDGVPVAGEYTYPTLKAAKRRVANIGNR